MCNRYDIVCMYVCMYVCIYLCMYLSLYFNIHKDASWSAAPLSSVGIEPDYQFL